MPVKARYWKNPAHHRLAAKLRSKRQVKLGFKGGKTPQAYARWIEWTHTYNKNPKRKLKQKLRERLRRIKISAAGFTTDEQGSYFYVRLIGTKRDK